MSVHVSKTESSGIGATAA